MARVIKNLFGFILNLFGLALCLGIHLIIIFANYAAIASAFEVLGYEPRPLGEDQYMGSFFVALGIGNATLANVYAAGLAAVIAAGFIFAYNYAFKIVKLFLDRRGYLQMGNQADAQRAMYLIFQYSFYLAAVIIPLCFVVYWDVTLFRLRLEANVTNVLKSQELLLWTNDTLKRLGEYITKVLTASALGYLFATNLACLGLEVMFERVSDRFTLLADSFGELFGRGIQQEGQQPEQTHPADVTPGTGTIEPVLVDPVPQAPESTEPVTPPPPQRPEVVVPPQTGANPQETQEVLGGDGERIARDEAIRRPDLYVIDDTGRIWRREFYEALHGSEEEPEAKAA